MKKIILTSGIALLLLGAFFVWRVIQYYTIPETPRAEVTIIEGWGVAEVNEELKQKGILTDGEIKNEL